MHIVGSSIALSYAAAAATVVVASSKHAANTGCAPNSASPLAQVAAERGIWAGTRYHPPPS